MKASPALLALVLLLAPVAGATAGSAFDGGSPSAEPRSGTGLASDAPASAAADVGVLQSSETFTNVLTLGEPRLANATPSRSNLSAALTMRETGLDGELARRSTRLKLARMNDTDQIRRYVGRTVVELEIRTERLRAAERRAYRLHNEGRITTRELLIRLARVDARAERLSRNASVLAGAVEDTDGLNGASQLDVLRLELQTYQGPVRDRVAETLRGAAPPTRVYVETGTDGVVLSTVVGDEYVREVYDGSRRNRGGDGRIPVDRIGDVLQDGYPIIYDRANGMFSTLQNQRQSSQIFGAEMSYGSGNLVVYVDRSNAKVFRERQRLRLNRSPPTEPTAVTQSGLELTVYPSYGSGPMLVRVEDARSGDPVPEADVTFTELSGEGRTERIGQTDRQGRLWAVMPNETVRVNAIDPDRTTKFAAIRVSPVDPRRVRADGDNVTANGTGDDPAASGSDSTGTVFGSAPRPDRS